MEVQIFSFEMNLELIKIVREIELVDLYEAQIKYKRQCTIHALQLGLNI